MEHSKNIGGVILTASILFLLIAQTTLVFAEIESEPYVSVEKPTDLIWTGRMFIFASVEDDRSRLFSVDPKDKAVERFGGNFAGKAEVHIASSSGLYFPERYVYANSGDVIHEITAEGDTVRVFVTPSKGVNVAGLAFDTRGYWNNRLIAVTYDGAVWEIDKSGEIERVADLGDDVIPSGVVIAGDEYGEFSGDILISIKNKNRVMAVSHTDHSIKVLAELPGEIPGRLLYMQSNSDLYISKRDEGRIVQVDKELVLDHLAQIMVITEGELDKSISMVAIKSSRAGVDVAEIVSGIAEPGFEGVIFVLDAEFAEALKGEVEEDGIEINPLLIIFPVLVIVLLVTFMVIWKYRGA